MEVENKNEEKKGSRFMNVYYSDPAYREKHLRHLKQKVLCEECNVMISRCNLTHHKETKKHINFCEILKLRDELNSVESIKKELLNKIQSVLSN